VESSNDEYIHRSAQEEIIAMAVPCTVTMGTMPGTVNVVVPESPDPLDSFFDAPDADSDEIGWFAAADTNLAGVAYSDSNIYRLVVSVSDTSSSVQYRVSATDVGSATHRMSYVTTAHQSDLIIVNQKESSARTTSIVIEYYSGGSWIQFFSGDILISAISPNTEGIRELIIPGP